MILSLQTTAVSPVCVDWGGYPGANAVTEERQYCSDQGSFVGGALTAEPEVVTVTFAKSTAITAFELKQADGMAYNPKAFTIEGQLSGSSTWSVLVNMADFDFASAGEVRTFQIAGGGGRRLQFGAGLIVNDEDECPVSVMNERLAEVDTACCTAQTPCGDSPVPTACTVACSITWTATYNLCKKTLERMVGGATSDSMTAFDKFATVCLAGVQVDELLEVARTGDFLILLATLFVVRASAKLTLPITVWRVNSYLRDAKLHGASAK